MQTLVLVRHAATAWNESGYCQGLKDVPLSDLGRRQVALLREAMGAAGFDGVYASALARAQETARLLGHEPLTLEELREIDRGHWEGHPPDEIQRRWGKLHKAWYDDPTGLAMPAGEEFDELWERAGRVLAQLAAGGDRVLACGHKAINRVLIARALGRPAKGVWQIPQPQACRTVLRGDRAGTWSAEIVGDVSHLPPEMRSDT